MSLVDGKITPSAIPDHIAYMMMLNFIGGMRDQPGRTAHRLALGYLKDIVGLADADANAVIIIAGEFYTAREILIR